MTFLVFAAVGLLRASLLPAMSSSQSVISLALEPERASSVQVFHESREDWAARAAALPEAQQRLAVAGSWF